MDQPASLLEATEEMLRIKHRWRCDFSALAARFSNVALTNDQTRTKHDVKKFSKNTHTAHFICPHLQPLGNVKRWEIIIAERSTNAHLGPKATSFSFLFLNFGSKPRRSHHRSRPTAKFTAAFSQLSVRILFGGSGQALNGLHGN